MATRRSSSRTATFAASQEVAKVASASPSPAKPKRKATDSASSVAQKNGARKSSPEKAADDDETAAAATSARKSRKKAVADSDSPSAPKSEDTTADPSLPKNTEMPATLSYPRPTSPGAVRVTCWNITSLKSSEPKGMMRYIEAEDADIIVLSETKVNDVPMHPGLTKIYKHQYWGIGKQKGYAGLAILSKIEPIKAVYGLPDLKDQDTKGRIVTLEFENTFLVGTYAVNAGEGLKTMATKQTWNTAFATYLAQLDAKKPVIWCGDFNVVQDERDLAAASKKWNKSPGYTAIECDAHRELVHGTATPTSKPLVDVWRQKHPDAVGHYTFYGWRGFCRTKGIGWRLDSFILSERIASKALECEIRHECYGASDHVPIYCDIQGPL
ncbi:related to exodeoxyribonuclease [Ustilago bromivora]|uniref:DNA-(apurinic or apyrimidinic site) endonuclease n=1 Tax=Ustilago bromivora TaxID=307758 RepID=A0A1K0HCY4_9BASI|nr:related to exodeoxyribonuclease [Ustilago bromivora]SPC66575.1 related to exodeoxyribonuclease [Ustilago sp. UG-2017b]SYW85341.1 related to exodeoxyribonuclease [Ustilago bromivora]